MDAADLVVWIAEHVQRPPGPVPRLVVRQRRDSRQPVCQGRSGAIPLLALGLTDSLGELSPSRGVVQELREAFEDVLGAPLHCRCRREIPVHKCLPRLAQHRDLPHRGGGRPVSDEIGAEPVRVQLMSANDGVCDGHVRAAVAPDDLAGSRVLAHQLEHPPNDPLTAVNDPPTGVGAPKPEKLVGNHRTKLPFGQSGQQHFAQL